MQVTITRTIQIPDEIESINELEGRIHIFGLKTDAGDSVRVCGSCVSGCAGHVRCAEGDRITGEGYRELRRHDGVRTSEAEATQGEVSRMHESQSAS